MNHTKGHLRIIACPGSGKTEVVSRRIARMIANGVEPKTIVAFTFTEKAAEQLKTRIRGILEKDCPIRADFGDMFVGTIHAFCFFMLKELDPAFRSYDVLDDPKRVAFLAKRFNYYNLKLDELGKEHDLRYYETIRGFLYAADIVMTENIDTSKLSDKKFRNSYRAYRKLLDEEKYFDFSSIMHEFVQKIKGDRKMLKILNEKVKHVVLDEYQDVNQVQEMLLELLSTGADSVCVVGDDDQNIYHWRGSDVSFIREFKERYQKKYKVIDVRIGTNFRSTDAIIHTVQSFIEHNKLRLSKNMTSNPELKRKFEDGDIVHRHFEDDDEEFGFMVDKIKELHGTDFMDKSNKKYALSYSDFAVLARTNDDAARAIGYLKKAGIKCMAYGGVSIFEQPEVLLAMDCIAYVFSCPGYNSDIVPGLDDLESRYDSIFSSAGFAKADHKKFARKLNAVKKDADKVFAKAPKDYFADLGMQGFYYKILNALGAEDFDFEDIFSFNLAALSQAISDYESVWLRLRASQVVSFFYFVYAYARIHYTETQHRDETILDAVKILTIHKAKGLEFPVIFIPNFEKKRSRPDTSSFVDEKLYNYARYNGDAEDERRVYYTAMTRSEKYLFITGSKRQNNRVKDNYAPNPFLDDIDKKYFSEKMSVRKPRSGLESKVRTIGVFPTSFSHLSTYGRCPQDFRLRNVYGFNAGVPVTFGYGSNIHNALSVIHSDFIHEKKIPTDKEIEKTFDRMFKLRYATKKIAENMRKSALKVVKNYVKMHHDGFNRILETEKNFEFTVDSALISGQIDLLKKTDDTGKVTEVEIIDFKTERKEGVYSADYDKQLRFYSIACLESLGLQPERAYVHHLDSDKKTYVDISLKKLDKTKDDIRVQVGDILKRKFPAKPSKELCTECDYRAICSFKGFDADINSSRSKSHTAPTNFDVTEYAEIDVKEPQVALQKLVLGKKTMEKARKLSEKSVVQIDDKTFKVRSESDPNKFYTVTDKRCDCEGFRRASRRGPDTASNCSHMEAVRFFKNRK